MKKQQHPPPLNYGKKKNPQDATRRNIQAANKKIAALTVRVRELERIVKQLAKRKA